MILEEYKDLLKNRLSPRRYAHSLGVADAARTLAEKYGVDPEKAYFAGLLHDIAKDDGGQKQLQTIKEAGIILSELEKKAPKLWHAIAGAALLEHQLGITDRELLDAVRYHTTARAGMSLLEKVIYLADFISADRDFAGVEDLRRYTDESLKLGMEHALRFSIEDLTERGKLIHPDTVKAYNEAFFDQQED